MDYSKYENKLDYPTKPSKPQRPKNPGIDGTSKDYSKYVEELKVYEDQLKEYENGPLKEYEKARKEYSDESDRLLDLFKHDLLEEYGLLNDRKGEKAWEIAWREGHSGGYNDVECIMSYLVELLDY